MTNSIVEALAIQAFDAISLDQSMDLPTVQLNSLVTGIEAAKTLLSSPPPDELSIPARDLAGFFDLSIPARDLAGFFDYELFLRFQQGNDVEIPSDSIGELTVAQFFDERYYLWLYSDVSEAVTSGEFASGYEHFINHGVLEGRNPSTLYSEEIYLAVHDDVRAAVEAGIFESGLDHFLTIGHTENRFAAIDFSAGGYLIQNPDVALAVENGDLESAFEHYIRFGADEGRGPFIFDDGVFGPIPIPITPIELYSEAFYLEANSDVAEAVNNGLFTDGFEHFIRFGQQELRSPSQDFNQESYLLGNDDVRTAVEAGDFESGFEHYMQFGRFEDRPLFTTTSICWCC